MIIAYSITANAPTAAANASTANRETKRMTRGSLFRTPVIAANAPNTAPTKPTSSKARPIVPATPALASTPRSQTLLVDLYFSPRTHLSV